MRGTDGGCVMKRVRKALSRKPFVGSVPGKGQKLIPGKSLTFSAFSGAVHRKSPQEIPILKATRQKCDRYVDGCFACCRFMV